MYRWLRRTLPVDERDSVDWLARRGETPGWDLEFRTSADERVAVEVKGTTAGGFSSVEVTANEWSAAERLRSNYWLYLVAACGSTSPKLFRVADPYGQCQHGTLRVKPAVFRLSLAGGGS